MTLFSVGFLLVSGWFWWLAAGVVLGFLAGLVAGLNILHSVEEKEPTWLFGNLPPLNLWNSAPFSRRSGMFRHNSASTSPHIEESLAVYVDGRRFSLGGRLDVEALALAGFGEGASVVRVRARALPDQTLFMSKRCNVKSFGGEFKAVTLESGPDATKADTTAFLFFAKLNPDRPLGQVEIERIVIVVAGGPLMIDHVTTRFGELASEMLGPPVSGPRRQRIWRAGGHFLVCEEEAWRDLKRTTFTWTNEELAV